LTHTARRFAILAISPSELRREPIVTPAAVPDKSYDDPAGTILRTRAGGTRNLVAERRPEGAPYAR